MEVLVLTLVLISTAVTAPLDTWVMTVEQVSFFSMVLSQYTHHVFEKSIFESSLFSDNLEPSTHFLEGLIVSLQCTIIILTIFVIYK